MIALFTDFGREGPYVGQIHALLARDAPGVTVIDLMHDAPRFDPQAAAHLLAAAVATTPGTPVVAGVVDPGVGTAREGVILEADGQWFVGPCNGLFDVVAARAQHARWWRITGFPASATFDGRDRFAPAAAAIARGEAVPGEPLALQPAPAAAADRSAVIYIDGFGNAVTGLRAPTQDAQAELEAGGRRLVGGRTFADVEPGEALWLVDSMGLVEVAVHRSSARDALGLAIGSPVNWRSHERFG